LPAILPNRRSQGINAGIIITTIIMKYNNTLAA
jgi:hypothetical protein